MDWPLMADSLPRLLAGARLSLELIGLALVLGGILALPLALARRARPRWIRAPAGLYVFCFRGTPLLVQLFLIYYGLGQFDWVRHGPLWPLLRQPFACAVIAFALNTAAYQAEILRGGLAAVPAGEIEAARALGMGRRAILRRILLPQAVRLALPAYGNEVVLLVKASSLASTITLMEVTGIARDIVADSFAPFEAFLDAGLIYLVLNLAVTRTVAAAEARLMRPYRR